MEVIQKNAREELRVHVGTYRGHRLLNARIWVIGKEGKFVPTTKGLAVQVDLVPDLLCAIQTVMSEESGDDD